MLVVSSAGHDGAIMLLFYVQLKSPEIMKEGETVSEVISQEEQINTDGRIENRVILSFFITR